MHNVRPTMVIGRDAPHMNRRVLLASDFARLAVARIIEPSGPRNAKRLPSKRLISVSVST